MAAINLIQKIASNQGVRDLAASVGEPTAESSDSEPDDNTSFYGIDVLLGKEKSGNIKGFLKQLTMGGGGDLTI